MHQFRDQWEGLLVRMAATGVPDVIAMQDVNHCLASGSRATFNDFMAELRFTFPGISWDYRHTHGSSCGSGSAVVWNNTRFAITGQNMGLGVSCSYGTPALVGLQERVTGNRMAVASVHLQRNSTCGISSALGSINGALDSLSPTRHLSFVIGDLNTRPDHDGETIQHGLESNPDCWYTGFSALHTACSSVGGDRYYDTVWVEPNGGAGVNPAATAVCQQYTRIFPVDTNIEPVDAGNSCTNLDNDGNLDRNRIDYIWSSWERETGAVWRPTLAEAQALIELATADTGISLTGADRYSDHRAVEAIVAWPPPDLPL